ncbi:MAG TPA: ATP phosphoribosyltransferase [Prolixibacteraceae bacterium]|nr:ATP phosphoribosyltransferase [Prolixibacteraceae bacterium]HPR60704.1 ATP phosphoribosyltransferase [Prolixibacteraceae bacterium]
MDTILRIAIQTKGRLNEDSVELINECGIKLTVGKRQLLSPAKNFPVEILYLRDDDIPETVADGVADIGIVGENEMLEKNKNVDLVKRLGFSKCRLSLAIPKAENYTGPQWFEGKTIATSYPVILEKFFSEKGIKAGIHVINGSVEIAPGIGLADGIFDIVSSGGTLVSNGLKEVEVVTPSEAVLIKTPGLSSEKQAILDELLFRIESVERSKGKKYIMLNAPNNKLDQIISMLPGMKSPTVMPLAESGWSSVHSVIEEKFFWENISKLKALGAEGILVLPIEKMIM